MAKEDPYPTTRGAWNVTKHLCELSGYHIPESNVIPTVAICRALAWYSAHSTPLSTTSLS
jgi:hypothetical protein